jgi:hypothetical protein
LELLNKKIKILVVPNNYMGLDELAHSRFDLVEILFHGRPLVSEIGYFVGSEDSLEVCERLSKGKKYSGIHLRRYSPNTILKLKPYSFIENYTPGDVPPLNPQEVVEVTFKTHGPFLSQPYYYVARHNGFLNVAERLLRSNGNSKLLFEQHIPLKYIENIALYRPA